MGIKEAGWPVDLGSGESERVVWEHALARYSKTATASRIQATPSRRGASWKIHGRLSDDMVQERAGTNESHEDPGTRAASQVPEARLLLSKQIVRDDRVKNG